MNLNAFILWYVISFIIRMSRIDMTHKSMATMQTFQLKPWAGYVILDLDRSETLLMQRRICIIQCGHLRPFPAGHISQHSTFTRWFNLAAISINRKASSFISLHICSLTNSDSCSVRTQCIAEYIFSDILKWAGIPSQLFLFHFLIFWMCSNRQKVSANTCKNCVINFIRIFVFNQKWAFHQS